MMTHELFSEVRLTVTVDGVPAGTEAMVVDLFEMQGRYICDTETRTMWMTDAEIEAV